MEREREEEEEGSWGLKKFGEEAFLFQADHGFTEENLRVNILFLDFSISLLFNSGLSSIFISFLAILLLGKSEYFLQPWWRQLL